MSEIKLENVTKRYPDGYEAVKGMDLDVEDGEFMILVGPSGCGKSTALRMIAGLEDISDGELRIGEDVVNDKAPKDRDIAMVFQNYALYPHMSVRDNMGFALKLAGVDKAEINRKVEEAAQVLDLEQHLDRKPANLSGGQRQRVAMGRAIVRDPRAFLMDEPLSNLDAKLRVQMRTEVSRIQQRLGTTTIYVTHDQTEAMTLGDRVAVMRSGVLQQVGSPMELYNQPVNLFVAGFIGSPAMNFMPATIEGDRVKLPIGDVPVPSGVSGDASGTLVAGIRPEDFEDASLVGDAKDRGVTFTATIEVLESMGSELYAHFAVASDVSVESDELRELAADAGAGDVPSSGEEGRIVARLDPASKVAEGQEAELWVDATKLHLFDSGDGRSLREQLRLTDVAVVGAGHNGLVAAAYLARAGLSVEVFERRDVVGGACVTEELWPGVRASPGAYTLSLLRKEIIDELELGRHGLRVAVHEPYLFAPFPDGRAVVTWSDAGRTAEQLERDWSAADARAYTEWAERREAAAARARPLMLQPADRERWLEAIGPELLDGPIAEELSGIPSEEVRVPLALQGLIGSVVGPEDPGTSFIALFHDLGEATGVLGAWGFAEGGMGAVTQALQSAAEEAGAAVHLDAPVESFEELDARTIVSAVDPVTTARLAGVDVGRPWHQAGPVVKVMCLLDGLPDFPAWPGEEPWRGSIDIGFSLADLSAAAADARAGRPAAKPWIEAACQTATDPTLAPPGKHVLSLFCQCFPADAAAEAAADSAIARFAEVCPELPERIEERLALGPRELEERFGLRGGHIFHGEMLPGQLLEDRFGPRSFDGVYLAGSGAHPGGAVTGAPGLLAARAVLEDMEH